MIDMKNLIVKKLKSNSGESIAETLVAVLIAAFALLLLAGTVNSASNLITKSQNSLKGYYKANNQLADIGSDTITITISNVDNTVSDQNTINKAVVLSSTIGSKDLISFR